MEAWCSINGLCTGLVAVGIFSGGSFPPSAAQTDVPPREDDSRKEESKSDSLELPEEDFQAELLKTGLREKKLRDLEVKVSYVADAFIYRMAEGINNLRAKGVAGKDLERELRTLHSKNKHLKGKSLFAVSFSRTGTKTYWFLEHGLKDHVSVRGKLQKTIEFKDLQPAKLEGQKWRIWESQPDPDPGALNRLRNPFHSRILTPFSELKYTVLILRDGSSAKEGNGEEKLSLFLRNLVSQQVSADSNNGINFEKRQISCRKVRDILQEPVEFTFEPSKWKSPIPPAGFDQLLDKLEKYSAGASKKADARSGKK